MATKRQILVTAMACSLATEHQTNNGVIRSNAIEDRFKTGWASEAEMTYWNGLSHQGQLRFMTDAMREYRETVEKWNRIDAQMAEWAAEWDAKELAESALGTVHSYEAEAVDEIIEQEHQAARETSVNWLNEIQYKPDAAALEEAVMNAYADAAQAEQSATLLTADETRCLTQVLNDDEILWLVVAANPLGRMWHPMDGMVYSVSCGRADKLVTDRFSEFSAETFEGVVENVLQWLANEEIEFQPEPGPSHGTETLWRTATTRQRATVNLASALWFEDRVSWASDYQWLSDTFAGMGGKYWEYYHEVGAAEMLAVIAAAETLAVKLQEVL